MIQIESQMQFVEFSGARLAASQVLGKAPAWSPNLVVQFEIRETPDKPQI